MDTIIIVEVFSLILVLICFSLGYMLGRANGYARACNEFMTEIGGESDE